MVFLSQLVGRADRPGRQDARPQEAPRGHHGGDGVGHRTADRPARRPRSKPQEEGRRKAPLFAYGTTGLGVRRSPAVTPRRGGRWRFPARRPGSRVERHRTQRKESSRGRTAGAATGGATRAGHAGGRHHVATGGRALLVYATKHGSTREIADAVADELRTAFAEVDVREATAARRPGRLRRRRGRRPDDHGLAPRRREVRQAAPGRARERPVRPVRHRRLTDRGRHERRPRRPGRQGRLAGQEATQRRQAHAQGALRPAVPLPWRHLQGLRAGAAAHRCRLRRDRSTSRP